MGRQKTSGKKGMKGLFLIFAGFCMLAAAVALVIYNKWDSDRAGKASEEVLKKLDRVIEENINTVKNTGENPDDMEFTGMPGLKIPNFTEKPEQVMPTEEIDGYLYIGVLEIPAIDRRLPVMETWDYDRLKINPCRYTGSYFTDDLVICAHNYEKHFSPIKWVDIGADVYFTTVDGVVYHYIITNRETVEPTHISQMVENDSSDWQLSLFTCNTGGQTRCAVRCARVDQ